MLSRGLLGLVSAFGVHRGSAGIGLAGRGERRLAQVGAPRLPVLCVSGLPQLLPPDLGHPPAPGRRRRPGPARAPGGGRGVRAPCGGHGRVPAAGRREPPPSPTAGGPPFRGFSRRGWPSPRFPSLPSLRGHVSPFLFAVETISRSRARTEADRCPSGARGGRGAAGPHAGGGAPCAGTPAAPPGLGLRRGRAMPGSVR